ncbi:MAG: glycosyltransferase [Candidatus Krumholzibacteriota bacterium]|nr:glycosyltransferase [Candidatus Krumholzibacteriota bacterium]
MIEYDIIIPTHKNFDEKKGSILPTLLGISNFIVQPINVFIISNGDDEKTKNRLHETCSMFKNVVLIEEKVANRAKARNIGIGKSKSDFVMFMDDDIIVSPEAINFFVKNISMHSFLCGAWRRYIPQNTKVSTINEYLKQQNYQDIDNLASDEPSYKPSPKGEYNGLLQQSTFISCFGGASRKCINEVGGYDEEFEGWGLEDTDLMRKLIQTVNFISMAPSLVWHYDHLVQPYRWKEHWGINWNTYIKNSKDRGFLMLRALFNKKEATVNDEEVLISPKNEKAYSLIPKQLKPIYQAHLKECVDIYSSDYYCVGVILYGSALYSEEPSDFDITKIVFKGKQEFNYFNRSIIPIDEHIIGLFSIKHFIDHPFYDPNRWFIIAGKFAEGLYLWQNVNIKEKISYWIEESIKRFWLHLLSYHLGRVLKLINEEHYIDRSKAYWHFSLILCFSKSIFPIKYRYPYSNDIDIQSMLINFENEIMPLKLYERKKETLIILQKYIFDIVAKYDNNQIYPIYYQDSLISINEIKKITKSEIQYKLAPLG